MVGGAYHHVICRSWRIFPLKYDFLWFMCSYLLQFSSVQTPYQLLKLFYDQCELSASVLDSHEDMRYHWLADGKKTFYNDNNSVFTEIGGTPWRCAGI